MALVELSRRKTSVFKTEVHPNGEVRVYNQSFIGQPAGDRVFPKGRAEADETLTREEVVANDSGEALRIASVATLALTGVKVAESLKSGSVKSALKRAIYGASAAGAFAIMSRKLSDRAEKTRDQIDSLSEPIII